MLHYFISTENIWNEIGKLNKAQWADDEWKWQLKNSVNSLERLRQFANLTSGRGGGGPLHQRNMGRHSLLRLTDGSRRSHMSGPQAADSHTGRAAQPARHRKLSDPQGEPGHRRETARQHRAAIPRPNSFHGDTGLHRLLPFLFPPRDGARRQNVARHGCRRGIASGSANTRKFGTCW